MAQAWTEAAGNDSAFRFVDSRGQSWENARYLQMLTRTTQARVHRESFNDVLTANGDDLARIVPQGDNCPTCQAWAGLIISVSGTNEKYPSYDDALESGLFHPNCDCGMERVDETLDAEDTERQANAPTPDDLEDLDAMAAYREEIGLPDAMKEPQTDFTEEAMRRYKERRAG
jgi:hypothetical protein